MSNDKKNKLEYVKASTARKMYQVSDTTLLRWRREGTIQYIKTPSGRSLYGIPQDKSSPAIIPDSVEKQKICYCRVSSNKQKDDLQRQIGFMRSRYPNHTIISDVGSGINWKRSGLKTLLGQAMRGQLQEVVVAHRDRLCRFAFDLIRWILENNEVELVVLNDELKSSEQELADDLLSIIHVFSCRQMGKRRYKNKKIVTTKDNQTEYEETQMEQEEECS